MYPKLIVKKLLQIWCRGIYVQYSRISSFLHVIQLLKIALCSPEIVASARSRNTSTRVHRSRSVIGISQVTVPVVSTLIVLIDLFLRRLDELRVQLIVRQCATLERRDFCSLLDIAQEKECPTDQKDDNDRDRDAAGDRALLLVRLLFQAIDLILHNHCRLLYRTYTYR